MPKHTPRRKPTIHPNNPKAIENSIKQTLENAPNINPKYNQRTYQQCYKNLKNIKSITKATPTKLKTHKTGGTTKNSKNESNTKLKKTKKHCSQKHSKHITTYFQRHAQILLKIIKKT